MRTKQSSRHAPVGRPLKRPIMIGLGILLAVSISKNAADFDCLPYKPEGARGRWHAEVVAGKICWYGANWRSFLPKQAQPENSDGPNKKRKPLSANIEESAEPVPLPVASPHEEQPSPSGLRPATPMEAEALINAISIEWDATPPDVLEPAQPAVTRDRTTQITTIFSALAIVGIALAMIFYKQRRRRANKQLSTRVAVERHRVDYLPDSIISLAPSIQPNAVDEQQLLASVPSWLLQPQRG